MSSSVGVLSGHLGGHKNITNMDVIVFDELCRRFDVKSFLDIGCGPGGMVRLAVNKGLLAKGIDGDYTLSWGGLDILIHDFNDGPAPLVNHFDLGWCVEVLEHIRPEFRDNIKSAFQACERLWITHALPGKPGHHHVNCQPASYWRKVFHDWGFVVDENRSKVLRIMSRMRFSKATGMLLVRE